MGRFRGSSSLVIVAVPALKIHPFCEAFCSLLLSGTAFVSLARRALNHRTRYRPLNCCKRYLVLRFALFVLLIAPVAGFAQDAAQSSDSQAPAAVPAASQTVSEAVADAEASMAKSDWKTAEAKLAPWLAAHPADARALFDAGYVADAQSRLDDAVGLYRRAVEANPQSFEAHISLGLALARQGKLGDARPELVAATTLDPGDAGAATKARAWRALAEIDRNTDATTASNDLLEALKLTPETPADTLLAADIAELTGQHEAAESAYRRILAKDPKSAAASSGLAHC